jgi:hypothetical protein
MDATQVEYTRVQRTIDAVVTGRRIDVFGCTAEFRVTRVGRTQVIIIAGVSLNRCMLATGFAAAICGTGITVITREIVGKTFSLPTNLLITGVILTAFGFALADSLDAFIVHCAWIFIYTGTAAEFDDTGPLFALVFRTSGVIDRRTVRVLYTGAFVIPNVLACAVFGVTDVQGT